MKLDDILIDDINIQDYGYFLLFNDIDDDIAKDVVEFIIRHNVLNKHKRILLVINSTGGSVASATSIIATIESSRIPVDTFCIGEIQSAAFDIFVSGKKRYIYTNGIAMCHPLRISLDGSTHDIRSGSKCVEIMHSQHKAHLMKYTSLSETQIDEYFLGKTDFYLDANECLKYKIADKIVDKLINL